MTRRDPEGFSQVRWNQWKLQVDVYNNLVLPNTPVCFGTRAWPQQKPSLPQVNTQAFFLFVSMPLPRLGLGHFSKGKDNVTSTVKPRNHSTQISCIWQSKNWYWYRWPPKLNNGSSNNSSPWKPDSLPLARPLYFQGLENQLDPWDYPGARKCDASSRWTGSEHSVNL